MKPALIVLAVAGAGVGGLVLYERKQAAPPPPAPDERPSSPPLQHFAGFTPDVVSALGLSPSPTSSSTSLGPAGSRLPVDVKPPTGSTPSPGPATHDVAMSPSGPIPH